MDASPPSSPRKLQPVIRLKQLRQEDSGFRVRISFDEIGAYLIDFIYLVSLWPIRNVMTIVNWSKYNNCSSESKLLVSFFVFDLCYHYGE